MLCRHLQRDPAEGTPSAAVILFEREPFPGTPPDAPVFGLGLRWHHSGRSLRQRFARDPGVGSGRGKCWVYHDLWALPTLADLDSSERRIGVLHSHRVRLEDLLRRCDGLLDGLLCVSESTVALARECLPGLDADRVRWIPYPVDPPAGPPSEGRVPGRELVLGYAGRIQSPQKRVERLPGIARLLNDAGVPHRWEFLGDGPARPSLERSLAAGGSAAVFHGIQSGPGYWRRLSGWDAIVFTSDFEGLPIALLEALSQGVVAVYPNLDNGGRDYVRRLSPDLLYPPGDARQAFRALQWLFGRSVEERCTLSAKARAVAAAHGGDAYGRTFRDFISFVACRPRVSGGGPGARRPHWGEWIPFGMVTRLPPEHPLRRGYA